MALTIRRLRCRFTVQVGGRSHRRHAAEGSARPQLDYSLPASPHTPEGDLPPSESASEQTGPAGANSPVSSRRADPRKVADRVYELMKEEARISKMRTGG